MLGFFVQNILSQTELASLAEQFRAFDKDGSGALSPGELKHALLEVQGIDYNEKELSEIIKKIDQDGDGEINYAEFLMASLNRNAMLTSERLEVAFRKFDLDGNGELSVKELKNLLYAMDLAGSLGCSRTFNVGVDGDGSFRPIVTIDGEGKKNFEFGKNVNFDSGKDLGFSLE